VPDPFPHDRLDQQNRLVKLHNYWSTEQIYFTYFKHIYEVRGYNVQSAIYYCKNRLGSFYLAELTDLLNDNLPK